MRVLGIDLGTTYSCACYYNTNKKQTIPIPNPNGNVLTPSIVYFESKDYTVVGDQAEQVLKSSSSKQIRDSIVFESKRHVGEQDYTYTIPNPSDPDSPTMYTPQDIAAFILRYIKSYSEEFTQEQFSKAVITVPAYFDDNQRKATVQAALTAGFEQVVKIINEPTAAALAYGFDTHHHQDQAETEATLDTKMVLVIDVGGGTTDFSIVEMDYTSEVYQVHHTHGDTHLGGKDFTDALVQYTNQQLKTKYPQVYAELEKSEYRETKAKGKLERECERVKKQLTYQDTTLLQIEAYYNDQDVTLNVSKPQYNNVIKPLLDRLHDLLDTIVTEAADKTLDQVLFIGGCTRIPALKQMVKDYFRFQPGLEILDKIDPDTTVCIGAGVQAYILDDSIVDKQDAPLLFDIVPLSIGIRLDGGIFGPIINRGELLPAHQSMEFRTSQDYTSTLDIHLYQGERRFCQDNWHLGSFTLTNISEAMKGQILIMIELDVDTSGQLKVEAYEKKRESETRKSITLVATTDHNTDQNNNDTQTDKPSIQELVKSADAYRFIDLVQSKKLEVKIKLYDKFTELLEIFQDREDILLQENKDQYNKSYKAWRFNTLFNSTWDTIVNFQNYSVVELEEQYKKFKESFYEALFEISEYDLDPEKTVFSTNI